MKFNLLNDDDVLVIINIADCLLIDVKLSIIGILIQNELK